VCVSEKDRIGEDSDTGETEKEMEREMESISGLLVWYFCGSRVELLSARG